MKIPMDKRSVIWIATISLLIIVLAILLGQSIFFLFGTLNDSRSPARYGSYSNSGYYEINPETIFDDLAEGNDDVFKVFTGNPDRDEPYYESIVWSQSDFLKIAGAVSQKAWNEPLDLENWKVSYMSLIRGCKDDPDGFHTYSIAYFKELGIKNWERTYVTRLIEITPWNGLIRWGKDAKFSAPILLGWNGANLQQIKITPDNALRIAEEHGGEDARLKVDNNCRVVLDINLLSPIPKRLDWLVDYDGTDFNMSINPITGKYNIADTGQ